MLILIQRNCSGICAIYAIRCKTSETDMFNLSNALSSTNRLAIKHLP